MCDEHYKETDDYDKAHASVLAYTCLFFWVHRKFGYVELYGSVQYTWIHQDLGQGWAVK